jgi:hypothetical protein
MTERALPSGASRFTPSRLIVQLLRGFRERGAAAFGGAYAELANSLLTRGEHFEDQRAERRYQRRRQRANTHKPSSISAQ